MKYWAYINNEIKGPFEKEKLLELPEFSNSTLICPQSPVGEKTEDWKEAASFPEIAALLSSSEPKHISSSENVTLHSLKPISISEINQPTQNPDISIPQIEIGKLHSLGMKKENEPEEQTIGSEKFDPISISQIDKKISLDSEQAKRETSVDPLSLSQISRRQEDFAKSSPFSTNTSLQETPAEITPEKQESQAKQDESILKTNELSQLNLVTPEIKEQSINSSTPQISTTEIPTISPEISNRIADNTEKIMQLIEKFANNTATKNDINDLKNYIDNKIDTIQRKIANISVSNIENSLKNLETRISNIENKIHQINTTQKIDTPKTSVELASPFENPQVSLEPKIKEFKESPEKKPEEVKPTKEKNKEKKNFSEIFGKIFKIIFKSILVLILILAIAGVTIFALKQAEIIDLTKFIPIPFISSSNKENTSENQNQTQTQEIVKSTENIISISTPTPGPTKVSEEKPKDLSEEVVYFTRTYTPDEKGISLENSIISIAKKYRWKYQAISWQGKMKENNIYSIICELPTKKGKANFLFEVDYSSKTIKPLNNYAKLALDSLTIKKQLSEKTEKNNIKSSKKSQKNTKKEDIKSKQSEDEEYVYEYVDEDEVKPQEQEYILPGVPKKK